jgi:D-psicose/D-tagatose/L-ribulose 3-epimerase
MTTAERARRNAIGVSTWLWTSPLSDGELARLAPRVHAWGFDVIELPIEGTDDWDPSRASALLRGLDLGVTTCAVMTPERDLTTNDQAVRQTTIDYLRRCVEIAAAVGSPVVAGPIYAPVGRVWRTDAAERSRAIDRVADGLRPVAEFAHSCGVRLAVEPLNRYETSLINTVGQALELVERVDSPGLGVCLDTFHMNIEEKDPAAAVRAAGARIAHVQACGTDRGTPGADRFGWDAFGAALIEAGYDGPVCIESFTVDNASLARAASIWRPLAPSADALAVDGLAFLVRTLTAAASGAAA